jgi:cobalt-zinc-cadmium efflux system protein
MAHDHAHGHDHARHAHDGGHAHGGAGHAHAPADFGRAFMIGTALNVGFVLVEAGFGIASNSVALLADAGHNLSDVFGLVVAWSAVALSKRPPSHRFTYGLRGSSILAALTNAVVLLIAVGAIGWEAIMRLFSPGEVGGVTVMIVAGIGILINGGTALLFASGSRDINIRGAFLHMTADAAVSAGVVIAGLLIITTGWLWVDPAISLIIAAVILWSTWGVLRDGVIMALDAVPPGIDEEGVRQYLAAQQGVRQIHDLHIWAMSTTETALTAHLFMPAGHPGDAFLAEIAHALEADYGIGHVTLQVETDASIACAQEPEHVV